MTTRLDSVAQIVRTYPRVFSLRLLGPTLRDRSSGRDNNCDLVRLFAATLVIFSHSYPLTGFVRDEPIGMALKIFDGGGTAVMMFFALSGFLVSQSWDRRRGVFNFLEARALRILPALIVSALVSALIIGPATTTLSIGQYLTSPKTLHFIACAAFPLNESCSLPQVFVSNPLPLAVNGSLWTISVEVGLYAAVAVLGLTGALRTPLRALLVIFALLICERYSSHPVDWLPHTDAPVVVHLLGTFVAGSALYWMSKYIPVSLALGLGLAALAALAFTWSSFAYLLIFAVSYWTLYVCFCPPFWRTRPQWFGDYSYGLYVFAFPVQQALVATFGIRTPMLLFATSFPITLFIAIASWHLVERRALGLKGRFSRVTAAWISSWKREVQSSLFRLLNRAVDRLRLESRLHRSRASSNEGRLQLGRRRLPGLDVTHQPRELFGSTEISPRHSVGGSCTSSSALPDATCGDDRPAVATRG